MALGMGPWLAAEIPDLVEASVLAPMELNDLLTGIQGSDPTCSRQEVEGWQGKFCPCACKLLKYLTNEV